MLKWISRLLGTDRDAPGEAERMLRAQRHAQDAARGRKVEAARQAKAPKPPPAALGMPAKPAPVQPRPRIQLIQYPVDCDCGTTSPVSLIGLGQRPVAPCTTCGETWTPTAEQLSGFDQAFADVMTSRCEELGIAAPPRDDLIYFRQTGTWPEEHDERSDEIFVDFTGRGKRAKFEATMPVTCGCGRRFRESAIGLHEGSAPVCPACDMATPLTPDAVEQLREDVSEELWGAFDELEQEPDDDEIEFILDNGRYPRKGELREGYPVNVVGEQFYAEAVKRCKVGEPVTLRPEPDNPHDDLAIAVISKHGEQIGYIPRDNFVRKVIHRQGKTCAARIWKKEPMKDGKQDIVLDVVVIDPAADR